MEEQKKKQRFKCTFQNLRSFATFLEHETSAGENLKKTLQINQLLARNQTRRQTTRGLINNQRESPHLVLVPDVVQKYPPQLLQIPLSLFQFAELLVVGGPGQLAPQSLDVPLFLLYHQPEVLFPLQLQLVQFLVL